MTEHLTPLDAAFLELEDGDESSHMHVGWTLVFDPLPGGAAPGVDQLVSLLAERLDLLPHFRRRLSSPRVGRFSWPEWVEDPSFDVANHVRRASLPAPGGDAELLDWLGDFYSHRLDRAHPLWEITLLEGLQEGRWALACKVHHSPRGRHQRRTRDERDPRRGAETAAGSRGLLEALPPAPEGDPGVASPLTLVARGARAGIDVALHPRRLAGMFERSRPLADFIVHDQLVAAPPSGLNLEMPATRRLAALTVRLPTSRRSSARSGAPSTTLCSRRVPAGSTTASRAAASRARRPASAPRSGQRPRGERPARARQPRRSLFSTCPSHGPHAAVALPQTVAATQRLKARPAQVGHRSNEISPASRHLYCTRSWRGCRSPPASSTSRSPTCRARRRRSTPSARRCTG